MGEIQTAGIILLSTQSSSTKVLLLKDSLGGHWGVPKGCLENQESLIQCALRECAEETGLRVALEEIIDFIGEVNRYKMPNGIVKVCTVFTAAADDFINHRVTLSKEHNQYIWAGLPLVEQLVAFDGLKKILKKAVGKYNYSQNCKKLKSRKRKEIESVLEATVRNVKSSTNLDWYIGGSFAASEETWSDTGIISDIDMVCHGSSEIKPKELFKILREIESRGRREIGETIFPRLSAYFLTSNEYLPSNDPFWSYFKNTGYGLNGVDKSKVLARYKDSIMSIDYSLFRLIWYYLLDDLKGKVDKYDQNKVLCVLGILNLVAEGAEFQSYRQLKTVFENKCISNSESESYYSYIRNAVSHKLDMFNLNDDLTKEIIVKKISKISDKLVFNEGNEKTNDCKDAKYLLYLIFAKLGILKQSIDVNNFFESRFVEVLSNNDKVNISTLIDEKEEDEFYSLISKFRLSRWKAETKWSQWRYQVQ